MGNIHGDKCVFQVLNQWVATMKIITDFTQNHSSFFPENRFTTLGQFTGIAIIVCIGMKDLPPSD